MAGTFAIATTNFFEQVAAQSSKPNILFIIVDDLGIDQLSLFGNGGLVPPATPNIDFIAKHGMRFSNAWAMPECSPSRTAFFTGRYPIRTGVEAATMDNHLPQSYASSFEATLPRVLRKAGYTSALIGKYHLGHEQDPASLCAASTRGWDAFEGAMTAGPPSIDKTAGGIFPSSGSQSQSCGYYQNKTAAGACYTAPGDSVRCSMIDAGTADPGTDPARTCLQRGGIFVPNKACGVGAPKYSDFGVYNGYYVWPRTSLTGVRDPLFVADANCTSVVDRTYLTKAQGTDGPSWWNSQSGPRMLTLSFNAMHTPVQKAPTDLVPDREDAVIQCNNGQPARRLLDSMIEGADVEIGRAIAAMGLGTLAANGRTLKSLDLGNTTVVLVGDNGSQGPAVRPLDPATQKPAFDPTRAKTTVYQTGVWIPLIIAGAAVNPKNRNKEVTAMVNAVDLFQLFGDLAGLNVREIVPPSHALDSVSLLPYLIEPQTVPTAPLRKTNFTQEGVATYTPVPEERSWPCQIGNLCNETLFQTKAFCGDNGGVWWGPGGKQQAKSCCAVAKATGATLTIAPAHQRAVRSKNYKLVELDNLDCDKPITDASQAKPFPWAEFQTTTNQEFYDLRPTANDPRGVDFARRNLAKNCAPGQDLTTCLPTPIDVANYKPLNNELQAIKKSVKPQNKCQAKGDGNLDMRVNQADIQGWQAFNGKGPSRYDINLDGVTDEKDLAIIQANLGLDCMDICVRADLNRDGKVNSTDLALLTKQRGVCTDQIFCGGDLDGDGKVGSADVALMKNVQKTCK